MSYIFLFKKVLKISYVHRIYRDEKGKAKQKEWNSFINLFRDSKHLHFSEHHFRAVVFNPGTILPSKGMFGNAWRHF